MALIKKGTCSSDPSEVIISESVYVCSSCDHTDIFRAKDIKEGDCKCSQCGEEMDLISNSSRPDVEEHEESESEETED